MNEPLTWTINRSVASIAIEDTDDFDPSVTVTAVKNGQATISLEGTRSGNVLAKCQVTVRTVKITSFTISPKSLTLAPTTSYLMTANVKPSFATYESVTWTSSAPEILSFSPLAAEATKVAGKGEAVTVFARAEGKAVLTAVTNTGKRTTRVVTVKNLAVTSVKFPKNKYTIYLEAQEKTRLIAAVAPLTAAETERAVTYTCSDVTESIVKLEPDGNGGVILTPKATGKVTLYATAGGKTAKTTVTIDSRAIKSLSVSTPDDMPVVLNSGEAAQLTAVTNPSYAANRAVTWTSVDPSIASVDENGKVTAGTTPGAVKITCASAANTKISSSVTVRVRGDGVYRTATVTAAGDAVLGGDPRKSRKAAADPLSYQRFREKVQALGGDNQVFANVRSYFAGDNNVATLNLEGTLTLKDTRDLNKPFVFQGDPYYAQSILKNSDIDAVNLANNHTYDVGKDGYEGTKRALDKKGVKYYGNGEVCTVRTVNGVLVAFVGFVSAKMYMSTLKSNLKSARKKADIVVAHFHWTDVREFRYSYPTSRQKSLAHIAINYGADLVIGTHTHRINGIERYRGKYIVYDLGNFVTIASNPINQFDSSNPSGRYDYDSFIYQQDFNIWKDGFVEPSDIRIIPCSITSKPDELINNAQPTPYVKGGADYQRVMNHIRNHSIGNFSDYPVNRDD